jgi:hypothetical protein
MDTLRFFRKENSSIYWVLGALVALLLTLLLNYFWVNWTFAAFAVSAFYFSGVFSLTPWKKPWHKALSGGIFLGQTIALVFWIVNL